MDKDMVMFAFIVVAAILIVLAISYFFSRKRSNQYIVFVDEAGIKTGGGQSYQWNKLTSVHYINKRVMGKGLLEMNYAIVFFFPDGKAVIDINSTIYKYLLNSAQNATVPNTSVVTKGLLRAES